MTKAVTFTQASVNRAVKAARRSGLRVVGITADGTVMVQDGKVTLAFKNNLEDDAGPSKWADVQA